MNFYYYYYCYFYLLSALIGDNSDAFHAGYTPAIILIANESIQTLNKSEPENTGVTCVFCVANPPPPGGPGLLKLDIKYAPPTPVIIPTVAPRKPIIKASIKNKESIKLFCAPIAFIVPISNILSLTDVYNVVIIPIAPTSNAINATP